MMSMNVWKRATLAIVRKPVRSGIIGLLMLMVFTSLVAQVGVSTARVPCPNGIGAGMGIGFTVSAGENPISAEEASRFSRIPGVTKTAYATKTLAQVDGARPVMPRQGPRLDSDLAMQVSVLGTTDSSLSEEFQSGLYRLEQAAISRATATMCWSTATSRCRTAYRSARHSVSGRRGATPRCVWPGSSPATCRPKAPCPRTLPRTSSIRVGE